MSKKRSSKSGVLTLRIPTDMHEDLAYAASSLGLDVTGLIRLMIRRSLPHFQLEARMINVQASEGTDLLAQWRKSNPGRPVREFWDDYYRHQVASWWRDIAGDKVDPRFMMDEAFAQAIKDPFALPEEKEQP